MVVANIQGFSGCNTLPPKKSSGLVTTREKKVAQPRQGIPAMNPYWRLTSNPYVFTPPPPPPAPAPGGAPAGAAGAVGPYTDGRNGAVGTSPLGLQTCSKAGKMGTVEELMDRLQTQFGDLGYSHAVLILICFNVKWSWWPGVACYFQVCADFAG